MMNPRLKHSYLESRPADSHPSCRNARFKPPTPVFSIKQNNKIAPSRIGKCQNATQTPIVL